MTDTTLPDDWVDDPPSKEIAEILNATGTLLCVHGHAYCLRKCGVSRLFVTHPKDIPSPRWKPIPKDERLMQWKRTCVYTSPKFIDEMHTMRRDRSYSRGPRLQQIPRDKKP